MGLKENIVNGVANIVNKFSGVSQEAIDRANAPVVVTEGMADLLRQAAAEGSVLLKNDGTLPLVNQETVSIFGRCQFDYFYVGYGSGGDVNRPYDVNLVQALKKCDEIKVNNRLASIYEGFCYEKKIPNYVWGMWEYSHEEMPIDDEMVKIARDDSDVAVVVIGRAAGEDRDMAKVKGSYYLKDEELEMLHLVTSHFNKVVVLLNIGGIIDMSWAEEFGDKISAILITWQGGMESGNAVADILCGKVNPSGRLTDTIAWDFDDYRGSKDFGNPKVIEYEEDIFVGYRYFETFAKDRVQYPFGFGLSYTDFSIEHIETMAVEGGFEVKAKVTNIGKRAGKEVVQLYLEKPCGKLGNPARELVGFAKTKLIEPDESDEVTMFVDRYQLCSFDDCGSTNNAGAWVIEKGTYAFHLGANVRQADEIFTYYQEKTEVFAQYKQAAAPQEDFEVYHAEIIDGKRVLKTKKVAKQKYDLGIRIMNNLPKDIEQTGNLGYKLADVKTGRCTMEEFVGQLGLDELEALTRGDYRMDSPLGAKGNAGAFAGTLESLREKGVPAVITTDGPSGIRLVASSSLIPIGTLFACSFDLALVEAVYAKVAEEMKERGTDVLLAPGMNIHRHPLCGRNFEYYSEDPFLTGKMGAASVRGIQSCGASACPKHFACNNQEFKRTQVDARVSERALREIYLKGFEICIKEAKPKNIMTSYNKVNGVWSHYHYDLCTTILRGEWNYEGNVMTDWWIHKSKSPEFPQLKDQAYRVRAQVDLFMPGGERVNPKMKPDGTLLASYGKPEGITLGEMQRSAMNVLRCAIDLKL